MSEELTQLQERSFTRARHSVKSAWPYERRLTGRQLARFLDAHRFGVVSTTRVDGRPHATMTSYLRVGTVFWLPTMRSTVRARNVQAQPWVSLVIAEGEAGRHIMVSIEGPAEVLTRETGPPGLISEREDLSWVHCWIKVMPSRLFSYAAPGASLQ